MPPSTRPRGATGAYKERLKLEDRPEWHDAPVVASRDRARAFAVKGMSKEALHIWENRSQVAPGLPLEPDHFALLLRLDRVKEAVEPWERSAATLDPVDLASLRTHLAARYLGSQTAIADAFTAETLADPLIVHL